LLKISPTARETLVSVTCKHQKETVFFEATYTRPACVTLDAKGENVTKEDFSVTRNVHKFSKILRSAH